jgi:metal-responsive CopG/Arc/MetJ family transcriptional regulator
MKVAISVPEEVFRRAEDLARRMGISRSRLYSDAVAEYLRRRDPDAVTAAIDEVIARLGPADSELARRASRQTARRAEW